jgi:hypothetical protein
MRIRRVRSTSETTGSPKDQPRQPDERRDGRTGDGISTERSSQQRKRAYSQPVTEIGDGAGDEHKTDGHWIDVEVCKVIRSRRHQPPGARHLVERSRSCDVSPSRSSGLVFTSSGTRWFLPCRGSRCVLSRTDALFTASRVIDASSTEIGYGPVARGDRSSIEPACLAQ